MADKIYTVEDIRSIVAPIARRHRVRRVYLFGSYARGDATEQSDVDLRVDAEQLKSLFALGGLYAELEEALGKPLDLITTRALRQNIDDPATRRFIRSIKKEERLLYESTQLEY